MAEEHQSDILDDILKAPESYRYGSIISGPDVESKKAIHGRNMIRHRVLAQGKESIYNMTGLVRAFPLDLEDLPSLDSQFSFYAYFGGRAEELAIQHTGGNPRDHSAVLCNRVTSGLLGIMLALVNKDDRVLSVVPNGRSHPSVQQAVELAGGSFYEVQGVDALERALNDGVWSMVVITPTTPQKYHLPAPDVARAISLAKDLDLTVVADDAHMASRSIFYDEPVSFGLGDIDVTVWSLDKHVPGPRSGAVVAKRELMEKIQTQVFQYGLEAQSGHYVAGLRGMEAYDPEKIREAGQLARRLMERLRPRYGEYIYQAGPGVAMSAQDFGALVLSRAKEQETPLIAEEMSVTASFIMLRDYGMVTIPITGYPGAAPTFRLLMHPDGGRLGLDTIEQATEEAIEGVIGLLQSPDEVRALLLGPDQTKQRQEGG
jgi:L-seryl-tRNA(Ser) seleniumtransferase